jgi:hypothetical protein
MIEENNKNDMAEAFSLVVKSLNNVCTQMQAIGDKIATMDQNMQKQIKNASVGINQHLGSIAESNQNIAEAFYYVDGQSGSVYHMAGSLNGIKHGMGYKPNPNKVFGNMKKNKDHAVLNQKVQIGQDL